MRTLKRILRVIMRAIARMIPTGVVVPIVRGPLSGFFWIVGAAAGVGGGLTVAWGCFEREEMDALLQAAHGQEVAFDIGANVGAYSLALGRQCRAVYAFEPLPRNLHYLHRILGINRAQNVTVVPFALGQRTSLGRLDEGANSALASIDPTGSQPTMIVSCDEFVAHYGVTPGILKIDVEGGEVNVLKGASRLLRQHAPVVLLSTHGQELEAACVDLMREAGYPPPRQLTLDERSGGSTLLWVARNRPLGDPASVVGRGGPVPENA